MVTISFWFWIPILVILAPKSPKIHISKFKFWSYWQQKWYRNPFLGHIEPPKEYGRHCHRYLGKFKLFWVNWITKRYQKRNFSSGWAFKAPLPLAGLRQKLSMESTPTKIGPIFGQLGGQKGKKRRMRQQNIFQPPPLQRVKLFLKTGLIWNLHFSVSL